MNDPSFYWAMIAPMIPGLLVTIGLLAVIVLVAVALNRDS